MLSRGPFNSCAPRATSNCSRHRRQRSRRSTASANSFQSSRKPVWACRMVSPADVVSTNLTNHNHQCRGAPFLAIIRLIPAFPPQPTSLLPRSLDVVAKSSSTLRSPDFRRDAEIRGTAYFLANQAVAGLDWNPRTCVLCITTSTTRRLLPMLALGSQALPSTSTQAVRWPRSATHRSSGPI
jgi:hypothetical protein